MSLYLKIPKGTHVKNHFSCTKWMCCPIPMTLGRDYVVSYGDIDKKEAVLDMARSPFETHPENVVEMTEAEYRNYIAECESEW